MANCYHCKGKTPRVWTGPNNRIMCTACYYDLVCVFCEPPKYLESCKGHEVTRTPGNRFMKDKEFVDGMRFEFESDRKLINGPKKR